jgi:hypothetical protein
MKTKWLQRPKQTVCELIKHENLIDILLETTPVVNFR